MKKKYIWLLAIFLSELFIMTVLNAGGFEMQPVVGNAILIGVLFLPLQYLLYLLGKDELFSVRKRQYFKIFFWVINYFDIAIIIKILSSAK